MRAPNKRLKLTGGDRSKGSGVLCPWRGHGLRPTPLRRRAGRPQLKRDPLGGTDAFNRYRTPCHRVGHPTRCDGPSATGVRAVSRKLPADEHHWDRWRLVPFGRKCAGHGGAAEQHRAGDTGDKVGAGPPGLRGQVGYAPSSLWSSLAYTAPVYDAHVLTMSLKALLRVTPPPSARGAARGWWGGSRRSWRRRVELRSIVSRSEDVRRWDRERGRRSQASRLAEASVRCRRFRVLCAPWPMHAVGSGLRGVCDVFGEWAARTTVRGSKTISCCPSGSRLPQVTERHFTVPLRDWPCRLTSAWTWRAWSL